MMWQLLIMYVDLLLITFELSASHRLPRLTMKFNDTLQFDWHLAVHKLECCLQQLNGWTLTFVAHK